MRTTDLPGEFLFDSSQSSNTRGQGTGLTYHWDFDGVIRQTISAQTLYTFPKPGVSNVSLYVTQDLNGETLRSETVSQTLEVPSTLSVDFDVE